MKISIEKLGKLWNSISNFIITNFLIIGFSISVIIALTFPLPGAYLSKIRVITFLDVRIVQFMNNCVMFFINGISLNVADLKSIRQKLYYFTYGLVVINFVTTLVAFIMIRLPFSTKEFAVGFTIFSSVPTTLGVGVALTTASKGDNVLALLLTVSSNLLGSITVPYLLKLYLLNEGLVNLKPAPMVAQLCLCVLLPLLLGILFRASSTRIGDFIKKHKISIGMFGNLQLFCIVWMAISSSRNIILEQSGLSILYIIITAVLQHLFYLACNYVASGYLLRFPLSQTIAVTIMSSQKSSPVGLAVISSLTSNSNQIGLMSLPCIIGQISQIFIGSAIATRFAATVDRVNEEKKRVAAAVAAGVAEEDKALPVVPSRSNNQIEAESHHAGTPPTTFTIPPQQQQQDEDNNITVINRI